MPVPNRSARLVAWSNAVALGLVSPDLAATEVVGTDPGHRVVGLGAVTGLTAVTADTAVAGRGPAAGTSDADEITMPVLLALVRRLGQPTARLALPVPGDPAGLPAADPLSVAAIAAGEVAVLPDVTAARVPVVSAWGLVPAADEIGVRWTAYPTAGLLPTNGVGALTDADHELAESLREATALLDGLDATAWSDPDADELAALRSGRLDGDGLAPGYPDRAVAVLVRARRLRTIVRLASRDDGGTLTASAAARRVAALSPLDRAARHAEMAAYNAVADASRQPSS